VFMETSDRLQNLFVRLGILLGSHASLNSFLRHFMTLQSIFEMEIDTEASSQSGRRNHECCLLRENSDLVQNSSGVLGILLDFHVNLK
jgi:hypothetical protein